MLCLESLFCYTEIKYSSLKEMGLLVYFKVLFWWLFFFEQTPNPTNTKAKKEKEKSHTPTPKILKPFQSIFQEQRTFIVKPFS